MKDSLTGLDSYDEFIPKLQALIDNLDEKIIVIDLRLPRIIMVLLVGAGLAVSGAASQGIFRNPGV